MRDSLICSRLSLLQNAVKLQLKVMEIVNMNGSRGADNVYPHMMENHICELIDKDVDVDILDA